MMEGIDGATRFESAGHFDETKATGFAGDRVHHDARLQYFAVPFEELSQRLVVMGPRQIADEDLGGVVLVHVAPECK